MIIQCEQCQTKFKLDDSKVTGKGIKVRCARCKHVFFVASQQPTEDDSATLWQEESSPASEAEQETITALQDAAADSETEIPQEGSSLLDSFAFESEDLQAEPASPAPAADDSGFSFPSVDTSANEQADTGGTPDEMDLGAFDFGDESGETEKPAAAVPAQGIGETAPPPTGVKGDFGGLDFSGDDVFGEAVAATSEEGSSETASFEMGMDDFSDSMGVESSSAGQSPKAPDKMTETPFSLDDIDFGNELTSVTVQQVSTEEHKTSQELLFAPLSKGEAQAMPDKAAETPLAAAAAMQTESPPVTSRRKEGQQISGMLVLLGVLIAGLVVFYSVWGYMALTENKGAVSKEKESGRIALKSVAASYVKNNKAGVLLVITGEAVNEHNKPQAAIEVKGIIFGAGGEELVSKSAFCGNTLSREQLASMPMDKIEATMANQFGDSLTNMEVAPGDAIPFVIVIPKPATGATDYGVEPVGSTVAADKEK